MSDTEYKYLGNKFDFNCKQVDAYIDFYLGLLSDIITERGKQSGKNSDSIIKYVQHVQDWISNTDFFDAPASTKYHESFKHGLLKHTLRVYNEMLDLIKLPKFENVELQSAALVCLIHDWCKIGLYEPYSRNVKNDETGKWEKVIAYKYCDEKNIPFGHGVSSMYMAIKTFNITEDEALAIRFHMGLWDVSDYDKNDLTYSQQNYPIVHLLQFADQLSITTY